MTVITWNKNGLKLQLIDIYRHGEETWFTVCKLGADPLSGRFGVRASDTSAIDLLVI